MTEINEKEIVTYAINEHWYNDIKNRVPHGEPFFYEMEGWHMGFVEVDIYDEELFETVSKELGYV